MLQPQTFLKCFYFISISKFNNSIIGMSIGLFNWYDCWTIAIDVFVAVVFFYLKMKFIKVFIITRDSVVCFILLCLKTVPLNSFREGSLLVPKVQTQSDKIWLATKQSTNIEPYNYHYVDLLTMQFAWCSYLWRIGFWIGTLYCLDFASATS